MGSNWLEKPLGGLVSYIARGVAPKYTDGDNPDAVMMLGQRCVRKAGLDVAQSRLHDSAAKRVKAEKYVRLYDILITATGVGCAGRVSQVLKPLPEGTLTDSHVLTLRAEGIDPVYLGYFVKSKQHMLELMAEGSTGQTEMNKTRVQEEILVTYPEDEGAQKLIADTLLTIDEKIDLNARLNDYLAASSRFFQEAHPCSRSTHYYEAVIPPPLFHLSCRSMNPLVFCGSDSSFVLGSEQLCR